MSKHKETEALRRSFEAIEVPSQLDSAIYQALKRGEIDMKKRSRRVNFIKVAASFVALLALFTVSLNTIPAFADSVSELPFLGRIVRVLQFDRDETGIGGEITDGTTVGVGGLVKIGDKEVLTINFSYGDEPSQIAAYFEVSYHTHPYRMLFEVSGARYIDIDEIIPGVADSDFVDDIYTIMTLDDSMQRFVVTFTQPIDYEVVELSDPAQLKVTMAIQKDAVEEPLVYTVRSASYPHGEFVGHLPSMLMWEVGVESAYLLRDDQGTFFAEAGHFKTEEEAIGHMNEIAPQLLDYSFYVQRREAGESPKAITP